jgi:predicted AAA+ superfamily ATPase
LPLILVIFDLLLPLNFVFLCSILPLIYVFKKKIDLELLSWSKSSNRKPLLVRGARQVGKSSAIRALATHFDFFLEINFEEQRQVHTLFEGDLEPFGLCEKLSVLYNIPIVAGKTLLFFDEIQSCVPALSSLRFFYEKMPDLHLIAAGSLLEFALSDIPSFGVGRIRSIFMYPFAFDEFLAANNEHMLLSAMKKASCSSPMPDLIHKKLISYLKRFLIIGGMPEVVSIYIQNNDLLECQRVLDDLIVSFRADFAKYRGRVPVARLSEVFDSVVNQAGGKFVYAKSATDSNQKQIKEALYLLILAGLVIPVTHSSANGIPLGAEANPKKRKMIVFDTGIFQRLLGLDIAGLLLGNDFNIINKGAIAEQFVGIELIKSASCYQPHQLYFWQREALNSNAEVDYLVQSNTQIIPIEVKSGTKGSMQSLFLFLNEKNRPYGVLFSLENFSEYEKVKVFPLYAVTNFQNQAETFVKLT